jgi:hypothetical protein
MLGYYEQGIVLADSSKAGNFITEKKCVLTSQEIILILRDP